jgi:hypothetical protein
MGFVEGLGFILGFCVGKFNKANNFEDCLKSIVRTHKRSNDFNLTCNI